MTPSPQLRVLVVEDETLIRWSIAATLAGKGHTVMEAGSAAAALAILSQASLPVDIVLLDLRLPDSHDLALLEDIRRMAPQSAVLMMTAYATPELTKSALALGACRVLNKPFDMHALESLILEAHGARLDHMPSRR